MKPRNLNEVVKQKPAWSNHEAAFWMVDEFNGGHSWIGKFSGGESPWEMHPDADELIHVLHGEVEVTVLMESESVRSTVSAGSILVIPKGRWHRQKAKGDVTEFGATAGKTEHSQAADPRKGEDA